MSEEKPEFKLIIAGGRDFDNYRVFLGALDHTINQVIGPHYSYSIVSGMARGADHMGWAFAKKHGLKVYEFPADWETHGKAAGPIRNEQMARFADGLLAFWDGRSRGTANMIELSGKYNLPAHIVRY